MKAKLDEWIESIENDELKAAVKRDAFVTGGSIASMLIGESIKDFDIYFKTKETTTAVARYYAYKFMQLNPNSIEPQVRHETITNLNGVNEDRVVIWVQSAGAAGEAAEKGTYSYFEQSDNADGDLADAYVESLVGKSEDKDVSKSKDSYRPVFLSQNAITLSDHVQLVIRFYGQPEDIYKNYDFIHVQQHYDYETDTLVLNPKSLEALLSRTLIYTGSLYPVCSVFRAKKFITREWKISAGQLLKMCFQLRKINWNDSKMVREQLTGVDAAYFHQLINKLEAHQESLALENEANGGIGAVDIDDVYLVKLIDEIFEGQVF
jgi:hypothetical protein